MVNGSVGEWSDEVLSRDENDVGGELEWKRIEEVFVRTGFIWRLRVNGHWLDTTGEHPFFVHEKGWLPAHNLAPGDLLSSHDGQWNAVEELLETGELDTVYNLRVADFHTYFVGGSGWGFCVWAHNAYTLNGHEATYGQKYIEVLQQGGKGVLPAGGWARVLPGGLNTKENRAAIRAYARAQGVGIDTPSPGGRSGGPTHRFIQEELASRGMDTEVMFRHPDGPAFADAARPGQIHQIGEVNMRGDPISRERVNINRILDSPDYNGEAIYFWNKFSPTAAPIVNPHLQPNWGG